MRVSVIGAGGYAGRELLKYLFAHPRVEVASVVLRDEAEWPPYGAPPSISARLAELTVVRGFAPEAVAETAEAAFLCLPGGQSGPWALALRRLGLAVFDLGGDLRLPDYASYRTWYGGAHPLSADEYAELRAEAVYGLPEWSAEALRGASLVTLPGCYPTAALLLLIPLLRGGFASPDDVAISAISGITGAGNRPGPAGLFAELAENAHPYKTGRHQHRPEIEWALAEKAGARTKVAFSTQLAPLRRGILLTAFLRPGARRPQEAAKALAEAYRDAAFVDVVAAEPELRWVEGTPRAVLSLFWDGEAGRLIGFSALDNLGKGAAAQAVQAFNLAMGWPETAGLGAEVALR